MAVLNYYYDTVKNTQERFSFYRIPKALFNEEYAHVSPGAKLLYGAMLSRLDLSVQNGLVEDEDRKVYLFFPLRKVMQLLGCAEQKAGAVMKELEQCGLIERRRTAGAPNKIFLKNVLAAEIGEPDAPDTESAPETAKQAPEQPCAVENLMTAVFGVNLRKAEYFRVGQRATELLSQ